MLSKKILQMEKAKGITIDEAVRMATELYEQVHVTVSKEDRRRERFARGAWALNLTCFVVAGLLLIALLFVEALVEQGKADFLPPDIYSAAQNAVAADGVAPEEIPLLFSVGILLLLPFILDIILAVVSKVTSVKVKAKPLQVADDVTMTMRTVLTGTLDEHLKTGVIDKKTYVLRKIDCVTDTLEKAAKELCFSEYSNRSSVGHIICIVFGIMMFFWFIMWSSQAFNSDMDAFWGGIIGGVIFFALCKLILLIYKVVMKAVMQVVLPVKHRVNDRKRIQRLHDEHVKKAETIYLTPAEQTELKEEREYAERRWLREKEREEQEFEDWLARKKAYCKFFNAGICNHLSNGSFLYQCKYVSNPGQCPTALMDHGLDYKDI